MKRILLITIIILTTGCSSMLPKHYTIIDCDSLEAHNISQCKFDTLSEFLNGNSNVLFSVEDCDKMGVKDDSLILGCKRQVSNINSVRASQQAQMGMWRLNQLQQAQYLYNVNNILQRY